MADRALHIAIDGRELSGKPTGVGRYLLEIMREWSRDQAPHRYSVVVAREPDAALRALGPRFSWCIEAAAKAGTLWEQTTLAGRIRREKPDVFFAAGYTAPLRLPCPFVVAIYDVSFFAHPEWFSAREGFRRRWLTRSAGRRAHTVVTISEFSREEITRHLGVAPDRIVIAPPGAPPLVPETSAARSPLVLYAGTLFDRRHIPELLMAFAHTTTQVPDARLVLVGDNRTTPRLDPRALAAELGIAGRVEWREYVDEAALAHLYDSARAFVFLSDYEGFGMTPLEALAHGVPSVLLDTPITREIYGDGALRTSTDPADISGALTRLLVNDADHAAVLAAGRARLAFYAWPRTAATVRRALEEAAR